MARATDTISGNAAGNLTGEVGFRRRMCKPPERLWRDESGQDLTEYALLLALIALSAVVGMNSLAQAVSNIFSNAAANMSTAT